MLLSVIVVKIVQFISIFLTVLFLHCMIFFYSKNNL